MSQHHAAVDLHLGSAGGHPRLHVRMLACVYCLGHELHHDADVKQDQGDQPREGPDAYHGDQHGCIDEVGDRPHHIDREPDGLPCGEAGIGLPRCPQRQGYRQHGCHPRADDRHLERLQHRPVSSREEAEVRLEELATQPRAISPVVDQRREVQFHAADGRKARERRERRDGPDDQCNASPVRRFRG